MVLSAGASDTATWSSFNEIELDPTPEAPTRVDSCPSGELRFSAVAQHFELTIGARSRYEWTQKGRLVTDTDVDGCTQRIFTEGSEHSLRETAKVECVNPAKSTTEVDELTIVDSRTIKFSRKITNNSGRVLVNIRCTLVAVKSSGTDVSK